MKWGQLLNDPAQQLSASIGSQLAAELARRLLESGEVSPTMVENSLAVAWALKDLCYAAWSSEPQRAAKAAAALRVLRESESAAGSPAKRREIEALTDWTDGISHITCGQMDDAIQCFDRAAKAFQNLGQGDHATQTQVPKIMALSMLGKFDEAIACAKAAQKSFVALGDARGAGKVSLNLGALHVQRGAHIEAARFSREASVLFARAGDHEHSVMADINMADALTSMGDFDEALRIYARAQMRAGTHGFPVLEAVVDGSVAFLQLARGRHREALSGFESSRRRYEHLVMPQYLAEEEKQLADAYLDLNLLPEALALFEQVIGRFEALNMPIQQAWALAQQGRTQALLSQFGRAEESFECAANLFAAHNVGIGESVIALARAELALIRGRFDEARELAEHAAQGFVALNLADNRCRADVVRANALLALGSIEPARALFAATLLQARELRILGVQVRCLTGQGLVAATLGDTTTAKSALNEAIELFEDQRRALPDDELRTAFLTDHLRPYHELLRIALSAYSEAPSHTLAIDVLAHLDRLRARSLGKRLADSANVEDTSAPTDPPTQRLRERLNWLYRQAQRLDEEGESSRRLTEEMRLTESKLLEDARRARFVSSTQADTAQTAHRFSFMALQDALGDKGVLVEYGVLDDELFACVVTRNTFAVKRQIASWDEVQKAIRSARFQLDTLRHGTTPVQQHLANLTDRVLSHMVRLHQLTWAPLASALAGCRRVLVVPHAQLGLLPFAALHDGKNFLAHHYEFAVVPSARLALRGLMRQPRQPQQVLALGESKRLPHAAPEAHLVTSLFPASKVLVGEEATTTALAEQARTADVIHLACHAVFRSDNTRFSALHLSDGPLTVELTESLRLKPCVVVLSACETGVAELSSGDEMVGLVRAFIVAGAARVVASLWPVDDAIAASFMEHFYTALCQGEAPAVALGKAQTEVIKMHPHPFFWAAFTLYGAW